MLPQRKFEFIGYIRWYLSLSYAMYSRLILTLKYGAFCILIYTTGGNFQGETWRVLGGNLPLTPPTHTPVRTLPVDLSVPAWE